MNTTLCEKWPNTEFFFRSDQKKLRFGTKDQILLELIKKKKKKKVASTGSREISFLGKFIMAAWDQRVENQYMTNIILQTQER